MRFLPLELVMANVTVGLLLEVGWNILPITYPWVVAALSDIARFPAFAVELEGLLTPLTVFAMPVFIENQVPDD